MNKTVGQWKLKNNTYYIFSKILRFLENYKHLNKGGEGILSMYMLINIF